MRWVLGALVLTICAGLAPPARADDEFDELQRGFEAARQQFFKDYQAAVDRAKEACATSMPAFSMSDAAFIREYKPRFAAYARKHAGKPAAIPALVWMIEVEQTPPGAPSEDAKAALAALRRDHAAQPELAEPLAELQYSFWRLGRAPLIEFYEAVLRENKDAAARAAAAFNLAFALYSTAESDADTPAALRGKPEDAERAKQLLREVAKEYKGTPAAERADGYVWELDHLQIGMVAPEIEGRDADEKTIKLSQFRGNVVVIDFWGFW